MAQASAFLPYSRQMLEDEDIEAVERVLRGDWLTTGPAVRSFETALASRVGAAHAVSCSSGTAALHLACMALAIGPGDAVIVPSLTFLATANAVRMTGAEPIFADVDPDCGLMTPASLRAALARADGQRLRVRAVIPVHLAGQCVDVPALHALASGHGAVLIDDACHAIGTRHGGIGQVWQEVGSGAYSVMTCFSFHAVKTVAAGEGGAVVTGDPALRDRMRRLRNHGVERGGDPAWYAMTELGWNYRLSDIHAALGESQLRRLDHSIAVRRELVARYDQLLSAAGSLAVPIRRAKQCRPAWHLYPVLIDFDRLGLSRPELMRMLREQGIGTQVHYIPVHRQPYYAARNPGLLLHGADEYYRRTLSLPLFAGMASSDVDRVVETLQSNLQHSGLRLAS